MDLTKADNREWKLSGSQLTEKNALWKTDQSDIAFVSRITFERTIARIQRKKKTPHDDDSPRYRSVCIHKNWKVYTFYVQILF